MQRFFYAATWGHKYYIVRIWKLCFGVRFSLNPKYNYLPYTFFDRIKNIRISNVFLFYGRPSYFKERVVIFDIDFK